MTTTLKHGPPPRINWGTTTHYLATRISTLKPPMIWPPNPFKQLREMTTINWLLYLSGYLAWTWDSFDFFSVSVTLTQIASTLHKSNSDVTWGITCTLMFRPVGAILFGIAGDRFGRKWPLIINVILFSIVELATGFVQTYEQFIAVRCLFGIFMGGIVGNASATAVEDAPLEARGVLSGLFLCGYGTGFLLATIFNLAFEGTPHGWRALFWFASGPAILIALFRAILPETEAFKHAHKVRTQGGKHESATRAFISAMGPSFREYWLILIYLVIFCSATNFLSHGSLDLYPTFLTSQLEFSKIEVTRTQVCIAIGQILGCITMGYFSSIFGRRLTIIICCLIGGALIPPYMLVRNKGIMAAAFWEQWMVQGVWGVVPIHLLELSPEHIRAFAIGTTYQLGNLVSSASSTIESTVGERFPLPPGANGESRYDYGRVMAIFIGAVYAFLLVVMLLGPERMNYDAILMDRERLRKQTTKTKEETFEDIYADSRVDV